MREILPALDRWLEQGEEIALATLVDTHGPSPRPAGARLCLTRSGQMEGSVSGGCVEGDVFTRAVEVLDQQKPVVTRYGIESDVSVAVGLSCGGEIDVLIEPFRSDPAWQAVRTAIEAHRPAALCTALAPDTLVGRRMAVLETGPGEGSIHPQLDRELTERARSLLAQGGQETLERTTSGDPVRIFVEAFSRRPRLYIVGATHIATLLCRMGVLLGFHVSVIDPRTPFATRERFPEADALILEWPHEVLARERLDESAFVLTLTHDMKFDVPTLAEALSSEVRYIGALGSRRTHERRLEKLREQNFSEGDLARIHTPIGLDLGARSPEEIALAILAEVVAARHQASGGSLQARPGPIHAHPRPAE